VIVLCVAVFVTCWCRMSTSCSTRPLDNVSRLTSTPYM